MKALPRYATVAAILAATVSMASPRVAAAQDAPSAPSHATRGASAEKTAPEPVVQTLGDGDQKVFVVDHHGTWSIHVENVLTEPIVRLWHEAGGPEVIAKVAIDRPYTLSVHGLSAERILERLLVGYDYTLHYDASGRLERVRVYSPHPSLVFKTPRLVESLKQWRETEIPTAKPPEVPAAESDAPGSAVPAAQPDETAPSPEPESTTGN
jgi:hypothetical protein